jgi:hypothetical protein
MFTEKGKETVRALFNDGPKDASILGAGVYRQYGKAADGFNISSCQFALHYFFENIEKLNQFLKNVSECTKVDGYFIGSCYDGATMFHALRSVEKGKSIGLTIDDDKIWEVTKEYSQTTYDPDISCVGYAIDVYQDSINKVIKEYLVNFTYFTELMRGYGFELLKRDEANKLGIPKAIASDDGGELKGNFKEILDAEGTDHIIMTTQYHVLTASQGIFKTCYLKRTQHTKKD